MAEEKTTKAAEAAKPLTLEQKFVKLREAVPYIQQKQHSDGVKYKFAKISDIYALLSPAMNEYGVNLEIIKETPTRHYDNGDAMYYDCYQQQTQRGPRTVWVYEADLTLCWVNADDPNDKQEATLHALGTNDGGPDKAKGSAWTYCLKYYFFEKFGVDQGEDDPDSRDLNDGQTPPQNAPGQPTGARNGGGGRNTPQNQQNGQSAQKDGPRTLSDAQLSRLYRLGEGAGYNQGQIDKWTCDRYKVQDPKNMSRAQYDEACAILENNKKE